VDGFSIVDGFLIWMVFVKVFTDENGYKNKKMIFFFLFICVGQAHANHF